MKLSRSKEDTEHSVVAQIFTKTLRDVYGIVPSDNIGIMQRGEYGQ